MELKFKEEDGRLTIAFIGNLDNAATPDVEMALNPVTTQKTVPF